MSSNARCKQFSSKTQGHCDSAWFGVASECFGHASYLQHYWFLLVTLPSAWDLWTIRIRRSIFRSRWHERSIYCRSWGMLAGCAQIGIWWWCLRSCITGGGHRRVFEIGCQNFHNRSSMKGCIFDIFWSQGLLSFGYFDCNLCAFLQWTFLFAPGSLWIFAHGVKESWFLPSVQRWGWICLDEGQQQKLSYTSTSLQDDPLAIAAALMPRGQRSNLVWRAQAVCHLTDWKEMETGWHRDSSMTGVIPLWPAQLKGCTLYLRPSCTKLLRPWLGPTCLEHKAWQKRWCIGIPKHNCNNTTLLHSSLHNIQTGSRVI